MPVKLFTRVDKKRHPTEQNLSKTKGKSKKWSHDADGHCQLVTLEVEGERGHFVSIILWERRITS